MPSRELEKNVSQESPLDVAFHRITLNLTYLGIQKAVNNCSNCLCITCK